MNVTGSMEAAILNTAFLLIYLSAPVALFLGWRRWMRRSQRYTVPAILSFISPMLATGSCLLAIATVLYAQIIRGFPFYDPLLLRIYRWGMLLSSVGVMFGIGGVWRASPMRWYAPASSVGRSSSGSCRRRVNEPASI